MIDYAPHITLFRIDNDIITVQCTCGQYAQSQASITDIGAVCRHDEFRRRNGGYPVESGVTIAFQDTYAHDHGFYGLLQPVRIRLGPQDFFTEGIAGFPVRVNFDLRNNEQPLTLQLRNGTWLEPSLENLYQAFGNIASLKSLCRVIATASTRSLYVTLDRVADHIQFNDVVKARHSLFYFITYYRGIEPLWQAGFAPSTIASLPSTVWQQQSGPLHQRIGIPRRFMNLVRDQVLDVYNYNRISEFAYDWLSLSQPQFHNSPVWDMVEPMRIHSGQASFWLCPALSLVHYHGYDGQSLLEYVLSCRENQGLVNLTEVIHLLNEYADMIQLLGHGNRYPQYLKVAYDLAAYNIICMHDEELNLQFKEIVSSADYRSFEAQIGNYIIKAPDDIAEMQYEGAYLSHSVARLSQKVVDQQHGDKVFFMRDANDTETPLITLNIRFGSLYQANGYRNRATNENERAALQQWIQQHDLPTHPLVF